VKRELKSLAIKIERIYDNPRGNGGFRILVDRLWPRGLKKDNTKIDLWQKEIAPSNSLRKWFGHEEKKWNEFKDRYFKELDKRKDLVDIIVAKVREDEERSITLLYAAKDVLQKAI
jgi:uncharacterized protein YeaO (DUF488 family)